MHNCENRLSQMIKGSKSIKVYDLLTFSELLDVSCERILTAGKAGGDEPKIETNFDIAAKADSLPEDSINTVSYTKSDEYCKTLLDYAVENKNYKLISFLFKNEVSYLKFIPSAKWRNRYSRSEASFVI